MKIPPKKPHFFKPIQPGFKNGLKIPIGFLKYLKGYDHIEHAILRRNGNKWHMKLKDHRFEGGWAEFVQQHNLQLGDILMFRHEGNMVFEVSIFDSRTHCNREHEECLQEEGEEISKKFEFKERPRCKNKSFDHSHFECTIREYRHMRRYLSLPWQFVYANGLSNKKCGLIIRDERQRSWNLKLSSSENRAYIGGGWPKFYADNCLNKGDRIMFEVITNGETPIWKFQVTHREAPLQTPYCGISLDATKRPRCKNKSLKKVSSDVKAATHHKSFDHSHFECTIRDYCSSRGYLYLPRQFAYANALINKKCGLIIRDERQRSWNLNLSSSKTQTYIGSGWTKFRADNCLRKGDNIMFEVVTNGETPIWKFQVTNRETPLQNFQGKYSGKVAKREEQ